MIKSKLPSVACALIGLPCALLALALFALIPSAARAQQVASDSSQLTPFQLEVEKQRRRLGFSDTEERRDAVMRLGWMNRPESSRVAAQALRDSSAIVRATAARAVLALPPEEAAALLIPQLQDRDEFVRRETAYALGETHSRTAVMPLISVVERDKKDNVRGAAVVALGQIGDEAAVVTLAQLVGRRVPAGGLLNRVMRRKRDEDEFVRRSAVHSLGQIGSRAGVPALVEVLADERAPDDVRREAANSLGLIGDPASAAALRAVLTARDPYLSRAAYEALRKIVPAEASRPASDSNFP